MLLCPSAASGNASARVNISLSIITQVHICPWRISRRTGSGEKIPERVQVFRRIINKTDCSVT